MLGVQHHVLVEEPGGIGARPLPLQHVEEVGGVAEGGIGGDRRPPVPDVVVGGDDHRHLGGEADAFPQSRLGRIVGGVRVERG